MIQSQEAIEPVITQAEIEEGLRTLGLSRGDTVEVHSSLSSFGQVEGGAGAVVDALMNVVGQDGALIMSAYPVSPAIPLTAKEEARGITWKCRKLDATTLAKTGLGVVVEEFTRRPGVQLGEGLHRVAAWGRDSSLHSRGYTHLLASDGWALLLGTDIRSCSSLHVAERVGIPEEVRRVYRVPAAILQDYPPDEWSIGYGSTPNDAWMMVWQEAERRKLIHRQMIGQAACKLFKANALVSIYEDYLRTDPYTLFGVERDIDIDIQQKTRSSPHVNAS